jgi:uncharacterized repeat protein (TIGR03803 family)
MAAQLTTLFSFDGTHGAKPNAALTPDANGDLFGTTYSGDAFNYGTVFEIQNTGTLAAPVYASAPIALVSFNWTNGAYPDAGLTADANGDLFGTTLQGGGTNGDGTVFELKNTGTVAAPLYASPPTTLISFDDANGHAPESGLIADANGDLFGTTVLDGAAGYGEVFEVQNTGTMATPVYASTPTTLVSFNVTNGAYPESGLITDANGDLFRHDQWSQCGCQHGLRAQEHRHGGRSGLRQHPDYVGRARRRTLCRADRRRQRRPVRHDH